MFFGTSVVCLALAGASYFWWDETSARLMAAGGMVYLAGFLGVTMVCNVPLNHALAALQASTPEASALWVRYLREWTAWNTARTAAP